MTSKNITIVTKENFEAEVKQSDKLVLIDFYADWCGPCKALAPKLDQIADENLGTVKVVKINVDEQPELAAAFNVKGIPLLVTMKGDQALYGSIGNIPKNKIEELIAISLQGPPPASNKPDNKGPTP
ncbi:MAG: thioredoxin [Alphaproteobacteria bacterium]|nr:thioredoxin [Alphaproteobacteria bacterium]